MTASPRFPSLSGTVRVVAVAAIAATAVLAPIRMAQGSPRTRFAVLSGGIADAAPVAGASGRFTAAAVQPAVPPHPGPVVTSEFPLSHLGVRWQGAENASVDVRLAGDDGGWGPWRPLPADHDLDDGDGGPVLSELIRVDGARRTQLRASGDAHDIELLAIDSVHGPRRLQVATGRPAAAAEDPAPAEGGDERGSDAVTSSSTPTTKPSSSTTTTTRPKPAVVAPKVITRQEWGADESIRKNDQKYASITKLFVHHTVTSPGGSDPDPAATVRAIYAYHVQGNGWDDIGYNFLVDDRGRVYEGRWARDYAAGETPTGEDLNGNGVVGAHVLNHNAGSAGVAMLGDFSNGEPTETARNALVHVLAWKADRNNVDVLGRDWFTTSEGVVESFPNLAGHRDAGQTECPGGRLYPLLPAIRDRVASLVTTSRGPTTGYWTATADGRVLPFGDAAAVGSMAGKALNSAIAGMAATSSGGGYWLLGADGGIFSFGDAKFYGSTGSIKLNKPIVGMAPTPTGKGYWLVASDGGIFCFGDAKFYGSTGSIRLNKPVVGMAPTPTGNGYWLVASDGGIFSFGAAAFHGSAGSIPLAAPIVSMAPLPNGSGYWLVARDGGVFSYNAPFFGSAAGARPNYSGAVQLRVTKTGKGYYVADANGGVDVFGDAAFFGADPSQRAPKAAVDLALKP